MAAVIALPFEGLDGSVLREWAKRLFYRTRKAGIWRRDAGGVRCGRSHRAGQDRGALLYRSERGQHGRIVLIYVEQLRLQMRADRRIVGDLDEHAARQLPLQGQIEVVR